MTHFPDDGRRATAIHFPTKGKTQQHHQEDCDIHTIVGRWKQGQAPPMPTKDELYADCTNVDDYFSAKLNIQYALDSFMRLPAEIRANFDNEPGELIRFLDNPDNFDEALEMGLVTEEDRPQGMVETAGAEGETPPVNEGEADPSPEGGVS